MIENPHYEISVDKGPKGDKGDPGPAGTFTTPTADVSFGNHRITNLGIPRDGTDAINKNYADSRYIRAGENSTLRKKSWVLNKTIRRFGPGISFPHNFPRGEILYLWFSFQTTSADVYPEITFQPYGPALNKYVDGGPAYGGGVVYKYDDTNIYFDRSGVVMYDLVIKEMGVLYAP